MTNIYSTRHEQNLETIYFQILDQQLTNHQNLYSKQQIVLDGLVQQRNFLQLIETLINQRLTLIDRTNEQMKKIRHFIENLLEQSQTNISTKQNEEEKNHLIVNEFPVNNLVERIKTIENEFSTKFDEKNVFLFRSFVVFLLVNRSLIIFSITFKSKTMIFVPKPMI